MIFQQVAAHLSMAADFCFFVYTDLTCTLFPQGKVGGTCCLHSELSICCGVYNEQSNLLIFRYQADLQTSWEMSHVFSAAGSTGTHQCSVCAG